MKALRAGLASLAVLSLAGSLPAQDFSPRPGGPPPDDAFAQDPGDRGPRPPGGPGGPGFGPGGPGGPGGQFGPGPGGPGGPGGRGGPGGGGGMRGDGPPLTDEQMNKLMAFLKDFDPRRAEKLGELKEREPEMFQRIARESYGQMQMLSHLKEENPEEYKRVRQVHDAERDAQELAEKIRKTEAEADRAKMIEELRGRLDKLFDLRETDREREVKELEKRLAQLKDTLQERRKRKAEIVERRLGQMTGKGEAMEW